MQNTHRVKEGARALEDMARFLVRDVNARTTTGVRKK